MSNTRSPKQPVADIPAADPGQIRATVDVMAELAAVQQLVAKSTREVQAAFDSADTARAAEQLTQLLPAIDKIASWIRANADVFPLLLALIQAVNAGREAPS